MNTLNPAFKRYFPEINSATRVIYIPVKRDNYDDLVIDKHRFNIEFGAPSESLFGEVLPPPENAQIEEITLQKIMIGPNVFLVGYGKLNNTLYIGREMSNE